MGKRKYIETPERMWELFEQYRDHTKSNPRKENVLNTRTGEITAIPRENCLTMEGFENYCEENVGHVHQYFANQDNLYENYMSICLRIRRHIRQDQIEGGMVGLYNPSITQRLNNLVERQSHDVNIEQPLFSDDE